MTKLLLVDDEQAILKVLRWRLESVGYQIETALSGLEALDKIELSTPDMLITDVRMPKMDGLTLVKTLKKSANATLPCIVMSGHGDIDMASEVTHIGAVGYIHKPVKFEVLQLLIKQNLRTY
ncbi:response regulator [Thiomicrospira microaerophila]|uniref:response regulator n=1 Tax=Thiomicrospira microaerophila TaxID=406020 RepID=UPI000696B16B|nr:response regulator [Thiomicrospira microaerophila]